MKSFKDFTENDQNTFVAPGGAAAEAKKALKFRDEHGDEVKAGTRVGWVRANQLAKGKKISFDTVKRMHSFFSRHSKNKAISPEHKDTPWRDNGYVSWLLWGGDAGAKWAKETIEKHKLEEDK